MRLVEIKDSKDLRDLENKLNAVIREIAAELETLRIAVNKLKAAANAAESEE